ncbi:hypothetical protein ACQKWADRAFT_277655 [Trichoderma austrokoningii]
MTVLFLWGCTALVTYPGRYLGPPSDQPRVCCSGTVGSIRRLNSVLGTWKGAGTLPGLGCNRRKIEGNEQPRKTSSWGRYLRYSQKKNEPSHRRLIVRACSVAFLGGIVGTPLAMVRDPPSAYSSTSMRYTKCGA